MAEFAIDDKIYYSEDTLSYDEYVKQPLPGTVLFLAEDEDTGDIVYQITVKYSDVEADLRVIYAREDQLTART